MKKYDLKLKNSKKIHFSDFCLKNEPDQVSSRADFSKSYQQISKMALPGAGRSFNLKSHQRRTHYLHPFQNGSRSPEHGAIVAPPTGIGLSCRAQIAAVSSNHFHSRGLRRLKIFYRCCSCCLKKERFFIIWPFLKVHSA